MANLCLIFKRIRLSISVALLRKFLKTQAATSEGRYLARVRRWCTLQNNPSFAYAVICLKS